MLSVFQQYLQEHTPITGEQFAQLSSELSERSYPKGRILIKQGEPASLSYFVTQGLLRSYTVDTQGKEHIIQFAPENWWIGDRNSGYFNEPAVFFVDVVEDAQVVLISRHFMDRAQEVCPAFASYTIYLLNNTIRHMQNRINQLLAATAEERYLDFIRLYPNVTLRVPQQMIASYLGITPESLSRVKKELAWRLYNR